MAMDLEVAASASAVLLAQGFLSEAGSSAWQGVARLLDVVRSRLNGNVRAQTSLQDLELAPHNQRAVNSLTSWIAAFMRDDPDFLEEVTRIIREEVEGGSQVFARTYNDYQGSKIDKVVNIETVTGDLNF
jgi:hypothetical protein